MKTIVMKFLTWIGFVSVATSALSASAATPQTVNVELTVKSFKPVTSAQEQVGRPFDQRELTTFDIFVPSPPAGVMLKDGAWQNQWAARFPAQFAGTPGKQTIRVPKDGAILRFTVKSSDQQVYDPIGITFERADDAPAKAVPLADGTNRSPFSNLEVRAPELVVRNVPLLQEDGWLNGRKETPRPDHITYKFSLHIKRRSDGAEGIIDPYVENENPS